jgi:pyruvate formate lyase activating enzyme
MKNSTPAATDSTQKGVVFNIQRFTVHDGPGIRTEVFLKGCPLKCRWCSNPEGLSPNPEIGVYPDRCIGVDKCALCIRACPESGNGALIVSDNRVTGIDREVCSNCLACAEACPSFNTLKIWGQKMTVADVMDVVMGDLDFYRRSGGGLTISGGEVFLQWRFAEALLKESHHREVNTCVETTLFCKPELLDRLLPHTDYLITDIKHMKSDVHKKYTGVENELILDNIGRATGYGIPMIIRIPIIVGINDSRDNILETAMYIKEKLDGRVMQVQLLPYKELGVEKYQALGRDYPMAGYKKPEREEWEKNIHNLVKVMEGYGVPAVAGSSQKVKIKGNRP